MNIICQYGSSLQGCVWLCPWSPRKLKLDLETNVKSVRRRLRTEVDVETDGDKIWRWKSQVYGILTAKSEVRRQWVNCSNGSIKRKWRKAVNECIIEVVWQHDVVNRSNQRTWFGNSQTVHYYVQKGPEVIIFCQTNTFRPLFRLSELLNI